MELRLYLWPAVKRWLDNGRKVKTATDVANIQAVFLDIFYNRSRMFPENPRRDSQSYLDAFSTASGCSSCVDHLFALTKDWILGEIDDGDGDNISKEDAFKLEKGLL